MKYKNILQIDDDFDDCDFFEQAVKTITDAAYTSIQNPIDALHKLINGEINPDLIFLDINMPCMSGKEVLSEIKKSEKIKDIPVIFLSTSSLYAEDAIISGARDYLVKPNSISELRKLLSKILLM
ncbi:response regulator [Flavobacterium sp. ARAG 55.4]|uniref:Response regulator n=1 Tax=Flavobacterium plantiphilum TaxID=3163297 RepID=A0ABW8XV27_9FLAO